MSKAVVAGIAVWLLTLIASGGFLVFVIYVIWHFVKKFW